MSSVVFTNIFRFIILLLVQVLILKSFSIGLGGSIYINILLYPLFIILLPFRMPMVAMLPLAFLMGISVDMFYDSPGVHASASVFMAFIRPIILSQMAPRDGYNMNQSPTKKRMGTRWFLIYSSLMMVIHLFFYFSVDAFTFVYIGQILLRTVTSFVFSMLILIIAMFSLNPLD